MANRIIPYLNKVIDISENTKDLAAKLFHKNQTFVIQPIKTNKENKYDNDELLLMSSVYKVNLGDKPLVPINVGYSIVDDGKIYSISSPYQELVLEYILFSKIYNNFKDFANKFNKPNTETIYEDESWGE